MSAWLSSSFSGLTDQLSSLANLSEPSEGNEGGNTILPAEDQQEVEQLRATKADLLKQVEAAEAQLMTVSQQYQLLLQQKEEEVKRLQSRVNDLAGFNASEKDVAADLSCRGASAPNGPSSFDLSMLDDASAGSLSMEQLQTALRHSAAECSKWKSLVQSNAGDGTFRKEDSAGDDTSKEEGSASLISKVKELEELLSTEAEQHQEELLTLQRLHLEKTQALNVQHEKDLARMAERVKEAEAYDAEQIHQEQQISYEDKQHEKLSGELVVQSDSTHSEHQIALLQAELQGSKHEFALLQSQLQTLQLEYDTSEKEITSCKQQSVQLEQLQLLLQKKDANITDLTRQLQDTTVQITQREKEIDELRDQLSAVKQRLIEQLDAEKAHNETLSSNLEQLRHSASDESKQQVEKLRQERETVCQQLEDAQQAVSYQKQELAQMQDERHQLMQGLDQLQKSGERAQSDAIAAAADLVKDKERLKADCDLLKLQLAHTTEQLQGALVDVERTAELEEELVRMRGKLKENDLEERRKLDDQKQMMANQAEDVEQLMAMNEKRVKELVSEHEVNNDKMRKQHESEMMELERRMASEIERLQTNLARSQVVVDELERKQKIEDEDAEEQVTRMAALESQLEKVKEENVVLSQHNEVLKADIASVSAEHNKSLSTLQALQDTVARKEIALCEVKQQLANLADVHQKTAENASQLRSHLEQLSLQHDSELLELSLDRDALAEQAGTLQQEVEELKVSAVSSNVDVVDGRIGTPASGDMSTGDVHQTLSDTCTMEKMQELQQKLTELVAEKTSNDEHLASVTEERDSLKKQQMELKDNHRALLQQLDTERSTHQELIDKLSSERDLLLAEKQDARQREVMQQELLKGSGAQLDEVKAEAARWKAELTESSSELDALRRKLAEKEEESAKRLQSLQQQEDEVERLQLLLSNKEEVVENSKQLTEKLSCQALLIDELKEQLQLNQRELSVVQSQLSQAEADAFTNQSAAEKLRNEIDAICAKNGQELEELRAGLEQQLDAHQQQLREKSNRLEELLVEYDVEKTRVREQANTIAQLESELEDTRQASANREEQLQSELEDTRQASANREEQLARLQLELSCDAEQHSKQVEEMERKLAKTCDDVVGAHQEVAKFKQLSESLQETNRQLSQQLVQQQDTMSLIEDELSTARQELAQSTAAQQQLQNEMEASVKDADDRSQRELQRLRQHLVQVGEQHTQELILGESRTEELASEVDKLRASLQQSSAQAEARCAEYDKQVDELSKTAVQLKADQDEAVEKWRASERKADGNAEALSRLQLVLEQFQAEHEDVVKQARLENSQELASVSEQLAQLQNRAKDVQDQLDHAHDVEKELEQLQLFFAEQNKEKEQLQNEVDHMRTTVSSAESQIEELRSACDNKVDRDLVKNLLLGYLTAPAAKRGDVLRPVASIFGFTGAELNKVSKHRSGWLEDWWTSADYSQQPLSQKSFTELFVEFLENESAPHDSPTKGNVVSNVQSGSAKHLPLLTAFSSSPDGNSGSGAKMKPTVPAVQVERLSPQRSPTGELFLPGVTSSGSASDSSQSTTLRNLLDYTENHTT